MSLSFIIGSIAYLILCLALMAGVVIGVRDSRSPWLPFCGMGVGVCLLVLGYVMEVSL